jgi:two-component system nitrate/nitrite response regulator NarL
MRCTSVVIADRNPVVLQGLMKILNAEGGFKIVASCSDGTSCIEAIRNLGPDIAILDVSMPGLTGWEILAIANSEGLSTRLIFFTASIEDRELVVLAAAGPTADHAVPREQRGIVVTENALTVLTDRERQIMRLVSEGLSNKEIGRRLNISDGTIKQHLHHVYQKLEISNRTVLAALAISQNDRGVLPRVNQVSRTRSG